MMKILVFIGFLAFCANAIVALQLLGNSKCSWGPSYWCQNITNAAGCRAVKHCIQTVWEHQRVEQDTDSVCDICLKMVKQARDQLESNETQEEIKEVFEGSCKLIPIKAISSECCKLADDFIPELIDTLASQMNPQMVCSVAGLCNSERIDMLLENQVRTVPKRADTTDTPQLDTCQGCYRVVGILENKFDKMSKDQVLQSFLQLCGHLGSFSDSCSNIIVTYFTEIYQHLQNNFNPREVCLMAGECSAQFHTHSNVEITPLSNVGFVKLPEEDDLPCDLCKQLVNHLRDLLIANTTEDEFQRILIGLCKQTGSFQNECVSIATEYYPVIYKYLVEKLNSTATCSMIGICPNTYNIFDSKVQLAPLLTDEAAGKAKKIMSEEKDEVSGNSNVKVIGSPELMQLPIERIVPPYMNHLYNKQTCLFCEYFLHYVQVAITSPATEEKIKEVVEQACQKLPVVVNGPCIEFVDTYGDAFVAILAQEIDPSTICPLIKVCPAGDKNVEIFMEASGSENSQCPLCLFAVTKIEELVKDKKTEESIKNALQTLCNHLSGQVKAECLDFVNTYSKELVELLIADLTPQEVCVYLKLCDDKSPAPKLPIVPEAHLLPVRVSTLTNRIGDNTANGKPIQVSNKPNCVLCEFIMSKLDEMLENKKTEDEIKTVVHSVCNYLPKTVSSQCNDFVDKYADVVIVLLTEALKPSEICAELKFCDPPKTDEENLNSPQCLLCKQIMKLIEKQIPVNVTKADIEKVVREVCLIFPKSERSQCDDFMDKYGDTISDLILDLTSPGEICEIMLLCTERLQSVRYDFKRCTSCQLAVEAMRDILANPRTGHGRKHVLEKACRALSSKYTNACNDLSRRHGVYLFNLVQKSPADANVCVDANICSGGAYVRMQRETVLGANKCTWGPGYWCESVENAEECGAGAKSHCQKKVWNGPAPKK